MKIYLSCDMEGTAGVCAWEQVDAHGQTPEYAYFRTWMNREIRAAIDGARAAGATAFTVNDSHSVMRNALFEELPADVRVISGHRKPLSMVQGADGGYDGAFFTGYHGGISDADATLGHTYSPGVIYDITINGVVCSEATLNALYLGWYRVPILLVTGDRTTVEGVQVQMPWVTGAIVKESIGYYATDSVTPHRAQDIIRDAASQAIADAGRAKPYALEPPYVMEIRTARVDQADILELIPGFRRTGSRGVAFTHDDYPTVFRAFVAAFRLGGLL